MYDRRRVKELIILDFGLGIIREQNDFTHFSSRKVYSIKSVKKNILATERRIIVSFTSYPARIRYVPQMLSTLYRQTMQPDEIVLWLAEEQFPRREKDLPKSLKKDIDEGRLTLRWCDDLKPHKKYFYAFQEYPEDLVITVDDDLLYTPDMVETLYHSYLRHPDAVSALRTHLMMYNEQSGILPYASWFMEYSGAVDTPSQQLMCTGVAGALYPVHLFDSHLLNKQAIIENCLYADDIWLKLMEAASDIPVVLVERKKGLQYIDGSQNSALSNMNVIKQKNDEQLKNSILWFDEQYREGYILEKLLDSQRKNDLRDIDYICRYYVDELYHLKKNYYEIINSFSFRIGRFISWPGRKIKSLILK